MYCIEFVVDHMNNNQSILVSNCHNDYPTPIEVRKFVEQTMEEKKLKGQVVEVSVITEH